MNNVHLSTTRPMAAKQHICYLCGNPIPEGTKHVKEAGIHDGDQYSNRMHEQCHFATGNWDIDDWENFDPTNTLEFFNALDAKVRAEILNIGKHPLQDIIDNLYTQDNRCTSHPMFCVQEKITEPIADDQDVGDDWRWQTVPGGVCFTLAGAEAFIRDHKHNLGETQIYVESYYRNAEMIRIRDWLMS